MATSKFDNIRSEAEELAHLTLQIKALDKRKKELEKKVKPLLADEGAVAFGNYVIEVKTQQGSKTLDRKALEATYGDLSDFLKQNAPSLRMTVLQTADGS